MGVVSTCLSPFTLQLNMSVDDATVNAAMDLFRRLPPELSENSLAGLGEINEDVYEELIENIDVPLQTRVDSSGKTFVLCDYCRDGDAYRYVYCTFTKCADKVYIYIYVYFCYVQHCVFVLSVKGCCC